MKTKHTKGKWYPVNYAGFINIQLKPLYGSGNLLDEEHFEEAECNAKLMSLAPEMYDAIQSALAISDLWTVPEDADMVDIDEAIALDEMKKRFESLIDNA